MVKHVRVALKAKKKKNGRFLLYIRAIKHRRRTVDRNSRINRTVGRGGAALVRAFTSKSPNVASKYKTNDSQKATSWQPVLMLKCSRAVVITLSLRTRRKNGSIWSDTVKKRDRKKQGIMSRISFDKRYGSSFRILFHRWLHACMRVPSRIWYCRRYNCMKKKKKNRWGEWKGEGNSLREHKYTCSSSPLCPAPIEIRSFTVFAEKRWNNLHLREMTMKDSSFSEGAKTFHR